MILFPAVDILGGECVRLMQGDYSRVTKYGSPVSMALKWADMGAEYLHIVDLDAAKSGDGENLEVIGEIVKRVAVPVQTGGGIRTLTDAEKRFSLGAARVILGTVCCSEPETVRIAVKEFGSERIVCGIDAKDGFAATNGWLKKSDCTPFDLGADMYNSGVRYTVYTDISKDGALSGVNVKTCSELAEKTGLKVIASGGVSNVKDIIALGAAGMYGAIIGKSLYENKVSLPDALKAVKEKQ